ncbi:MAG: MFS family permease [Minisyncoccia bacterium]|jgi:MFS family permease
MDRFGRLAAMMPAFALSSFGLIILGVANTTSPAVAAGATIGIGLSAGTMLTLGSDLAPPGQFLAGMASIQDSGRVAGPLLVGAVGAALGLGAAAFALAAVLLVGIAWLTLVIGETGQTYGRSDSATSS